MKLTRIAIVCLLLAPATVTAQAAAKAADPVTGHWMSGGRTLLRLTYDGKTVSGVVVVRDTTNLAPIKSGLFDAQTNTLKLEGDAKHPETGEVRHFVIDGRIQGDSLRVHAVVGSEDQNVTLTRAPTGASSDTVTMALRYGFSEVSAWISKAAELVPANRYTYRPVSSVRTFGQLVAHVADGYNAYCGAVAPGKRVQWSDATEKGKTDKATVALELKRAVDACSAAYNAPGQFPPLMANIAHANLHYGNIITYMRMMGLVPPSS